MDALQQLADAVGADLLEGRITDRNALAVAKRRKAAGLGIAPPPDRELAEHLPADVRERFATLLRTKPVRSLSGVAVVAVMSSPASCPHGKCTFCPGGPEVDAPQSYTGFEPSTLRARRLDYDPYRIVRSRLGQLRRNGHTIDKVDLVVQGGTFPARDGAYQDWFIASIYAGLNDGPCDDEPPLWESETDWALLGPEVRAGRLKDVQANNRGAACRAIGLTIETKPDWCFEEHLDRMLAQGATRVELGLQTLDDDVLRLTHRGHDLADSRKAMQLARDAGLKVCVHMMPGLPRRRTGQAASAEAAGRSPSLGAHDPLGTKGSLDPIPEADADDMRRLFAEADWRPDMLKIYPTLVVEEGETTLKQQWKRGEFHPYDAATAAALVGATKSHVPAWCRIQRIDRDIPTTHVLGGVEKSNLRQLAQAWRAKQGLPPCVCIRCREPGHIADGDAIRPEDLRLARRDYDASNGIETFLSWESDKPDALVAFLRLRKASPAAHRVETHVAGGAAFVRELKVYGLQAAIGDDPEAGGFQHRGLGARLLEEAERIAFGEWGVGRILVTAGVGVQAYYAKHGYAECGPYMGKERILREKPASG